MMTQKRKSGYVNFQTQKGIQLANNRSVIKNR